MTNIRCKYCGFLDKNTELKEENIKLKKLLKQLKKYLPKYLPVTLFTKIDKILGEQK